MAQGQLIRPTLEQRTTRVHTHKVRLELDLELRPPMSFTGYSQELQSAWCSDCYRPRSRRLRAGSGLCSCASTRPRRGVRRRNRCSVVLCGNAAPMSGVLGECEINSSAQRNWAQQARDDAPAKTFAPDGEGNGALHGAVDCRGDDYSEACHPERKLVRTHP